MQLNAKKIIAFILIAAGLLFFMSAFILWRTQFETLVELKRTREIEERNAFQNYLTILNEPQRLLTYDYSYWDDMVSFVSTNDSAWAEENLSAALTTFDVDFVWVLDTKLNSFYCSFEQVEDSTEPMAIPAGVIEDLSGKWFNHFFAISSQGLIEINTAPIQPSADEARITPPAGYLVTGRLWDKSRLDRIAAFTGCELSLARIDTCNVKKDNGDYFPKDEDEGLKFHVELFNKDNSSVACLLVRIDSGIFSQALLSIKQELYIYSAFVILIITLITIIAIKLIYKPIHKITASLINEDPSLVADLIEKPHEFGALARLVTQSFAHRKALCEEIEKQKISEAALKESENRYRVLVENAFDAIYLLRGKRYEYVNPRFCQITGYSFEEVTSPTFDYNVLLSVETRQLLENRYLARMRGEKIPGEYQITIVNRSGGLIDIEVSTVSINETPNIAVLGIMRDVTERKNAETALKALTSRQEAILDAVPDIIMEVNNEKVYTWANKSGFDFFGDDVIGKNADSYFVGVQDTYQVVQPLFEGRGDLTYVESWQRRKDGEVRLLAWWCRSLKDEKGVVIGALSSAEDITERRQIEDSVKSSEAKYHELFENSRDAVYLSTQAGELVDINRAMLDMFGFKKAEILGLNAVDFYVEPGNRAKLVLQMEQNGGIQDFEVKLKKKDGIIIDCLISANVQLDNSGEVTGYQGIIRDITSRKQLEEQLFQAQKMESVGRLAGGVAHDFNNMLQAVMGNLELALQDIMPGTDLYEYLQSAYNSAERSANLTRQLLAFARKQIISPKVIDMNDSIEGMLKMLRRLLGEQVTLSWKPGLKLWHVRIDPAQIDQILANLCVNARDAIESAGYVDVETRNITIDAEFCSTHPDAVPGDYIVLSVADSGCGMSSETIERIFEPFYTTKELGKGTGLGLATVYGIVRQNEGFIDVESEPNKGTKFSICFPRFAAELTEIEEPVDKPSPRSQGEIVLLVEDEKEILKIAEGMLQFLGYSVMTAGHPAEALEIVRNYKGRIDLLITDVVMPAMNGHELFHQIKQIRPDIKCLYMSGHNEDVFGDKGFLGEGINFLQKPFIISNLAEKIREAADKV